MMSGPVLTDQARSGVECREKWIAASRKTGNRRDTEKEIRQYQSLSLKLSSTEAPICYAHVMAKEIRQLIS